VLDDVSSDAATAVEDDEDAFDEAAVDLAVDTGFNTV
jgi:hypothetical protein